MSGLSAEVLVFGEPSTGAEEDLKRATYIAKDMVGRFGMGKRRRRLLEDDAEVFLGDAPGLDQISASTHQEMEAEVDRLIEEAEGEATRLLREHRDVLEGLATRLATEETLEGADLEAALAPVRPRVRLFSGIDKSSDGGRAKRPVKGGRR